MNTRHTPFQFRPALVTTFLGLLFVLSDAPTQSQSLTPAPDIKTAGGITTITFYLAPGKLAVNLPDDMRAGDTISGTVIAEPKGPTPEERAKNQRALAGLALEIDGKRVEPFSGSPGPEGEAVVAQNFWIYTTTLSGNDKSIPIVVNDPGVGALAQTVLARPTFEPLLAQPTHPSGAVVTPDPKITNPPFTFPPVGQTGRRIVVTGPFDGIGANTEVRIGDGEDRDSMGRLDLIAESPRKAIFAAPANVIGPTRLHLTEGNTRTTGNYRNVGVSLSAPKTSLLKGERTTLTVEVNGLAGIKNDVPLQLDATGVILMDGGNFQNLRIKPPEVNRDGKYFVNRAITGQQAGAFTVVATVVVSRFDVCIADDGNRHSGILWNTFTGDYVFVNPFPPPRPGGQSPSGGTSSPSGNPAVPPGGTGLTGTGKPIMKGCIITLTHNAPDRRVFAKLDACTKTGEGSVETTAPKSSVTITDKNVSDNSCGVK